MVLLHAKYIYGAVRKVYKIKFRPAIKLNHKKEIETMLNKATEPILYVSNYFQSFFPLIFIYLFLTAMLSALTPKKIRL